MIKRTIFAIMTLSLATHAMADNKKINIRIIETSDVHGCFFPYDFIERKPKIGSLARVSTYVNKLRKSYGDNVILLDNGDILRGQPVCYYSNYIADKEPNIAAEVVNYMKYDAQAFGNHDVETGHNVYDKWINETKCPVIAANIINIETSKPYVQPYTIINKEGIKIAILGMLTPAIPNWLSPDLWSGLTFESIKKSAAFWIDYLKKNENPDVIVGLFHSGWDGGIKTADYMEDETSEVARTIPGFDIIFFGHDHTEKNETITNNYGEKVLCLDPSCNAMMVADAELEIEMCGSEIISKKITGKIQDIRNEEIDKDFLNRFEESISKINSYVNRKIADITSTISMRDCFFGNAPFTDLVHNIQLKQTGADISFCAPLSFDIQIPEGPVFVSDMFKICRFENQVYVLNMTGEEIRKYLEMSYGLWANTMKAPDDHIMLLDDANHDDMQRRGFKNFTFNFDSAAGIDYEVDVTRPEGNRINIIRMSNGKPFDKNAWYKVVMNSYRGSGGGELLTKGAGIPKDSLAGRTVYQSEKDQRYYIMKEIEDTGIVTPTANRNWKFVPEKWTIQAIKRDRQIIFGK